MLRATFVVRDLISTHESSACDMINCSVQLLTCRFTVIFALCDNRMGPLNLMTLKAVPSPVHVVLYTRLHQISTLSSVAVTGIATLSYLSHRIIGDRMSIVSNRCPELWNVLSRGQNLKLAQGSGHDTSMCQEGIRSTKMF